MKQQIKCPHCNKFFPIEESLKHEAEEYRKKLQLEEEKNLKNVRKNWKSNLIKNLKNKMKPMQKN